MDTNTLKKIIACSQPVGIAGGEERKVTFSYESMVKAAELIGLEIASKREVFDDLRKLGFTDAKMDSERRIAAPLRLVVHIVIPVAKEVLSDYEKTEK